MFERSKEAEKWIVRYEERVKQVRKKLIGFHDEGATATVYLKLGSKVYVMGQTGFGASLYESLGFRPSFHVMCLIQQEQ
ncbi:MAG: Fe3+-citrate ABC transporter substrate-binding protein, partial [Kurthia sp.]